MSLPENKKVTRTVTQSVKTWVYGQPNIGKTTFANQWPNALMLNTDGNYKRIDSPVIAITGDDKTEPWEQFVAAVDEFLKGHHTFETIVIDLLEDVYQYARAYYCKKLKIDHEADLGFAKAYDIVRNSFLIVLRKLANSPYNLVLISHEDAVIVKNRVGKETTVYSPAINDKIMKKIAGMVELTGRISMMTDVDKDGNPYDHRILYLNSSSEQFGGNKMDLHDEYIDLGYEYLIESIKGNRTTKMTINELPGQMTIDDLSPIDQMAAEDEISDNVNVEEKPASRVGMKITRKNKEEK